MMKRIVLALVLMLAGKVSAQQVAEPLTDEAIAAALALYNRAGTIRMTGDSRIAAGTEIVGDLAVLEGLLEVDGRIRGDLLVLNGDLRLSATAQIDGAVLVIGGSVAGLESARITGPVRIYRGNFRYQVRDGVLIQATQRMLPTELAAGREFDFGRADLIVSARGGYNRVEGLPIYAGPRLTLGHSNPTILEGLGIYRTATGTSPDADDLGYGVRIEQYLGGRRAARIGVRAFSEIAAIEQGGLTDRETSLSAFVLHEDFRDHYKRQGLQAYARYNPGQYPWGLSVEYTDERHAPVTDRDPWSLFRNGEDWRVEPLAANGYLRTLAAQLDFDTRNEADDPSHGWWLTAEIERGLGGSLRTRADTINESAPRRFWHGELDLRRYARLGPSSRLAVRLLATGSITGDALPVARQHALGGEGSLPGFEFRRFDCGAQRRVVSRGGADYQLYYGCDRAAMVQVEYQTDFAFLRRLRQSPIDQLGLLQSARLAAFFDAGRAWNDEDARGRRGSGNDDFAADAGFGLRLGSVGLYWAVPLSGRGEPMNFFVRIGRRL